jgi:hypothetical protein
VLIHLVAVGEKNKELTYLTNELNIKEYKKGKKNPKFWASQCLLKYVSSYSLKIGLESIRIQKLRVAYAYPHWALFGAALVFGYLISS